VESTASRHSLSAGWEEQRKRIDWMHTPGMATYVNEMVSGVPLNGGGHWCEYARDRFLLPLSERLGRKLSMVSLGCGRGRIEHSAVVNWGWPIARLVGLEFDGALRAAARDTWQKVPDVDANFLRYDFNQDVQDEHGEFDLVFSHHAIHHVTNLERFLPFANSLIAPHGIFLGSEYFGPTRFQVEGQTRELINRLNAALPDELKIDLRSELLRRDVVYSTISSIMKVDPSEAARSSDLRTMLFANFPVIDKKPMGGTLLRWLLQYRAGNFDRANACHLAIARLLIIYEQTLIERGVLQSDDLFFVLGKSASL